MDLRRLTHFLAVAEELHFGRAAARLGMTQPPLSQSIMALESELGAPLFIRTKRHVALTAFGRQWLDHVRPAVDMVDQLSATARRIRDGMAGQLDLSFVSTADYHVLPQLVRRFTDQYPDVELRLSEATSDVQIPALLERRADAGIIIPPGAGLPSDLSYLRLVSEPLVAAVPDMWIGRRITIVDGKAAPRTMAGLPLVIFPRAVAPAFHDLVTGYFVEQGEQAHIVQQAIQMQTIISLVSAGLGVALVPASLRRLAREGVSYVDLEDAPFLETGLAWRTDNDGPTLRHFVEIVQGITDWVSGDGPSPE